MPAHYSVKNSHTCLITDVRSRMVQKLSCEKKDLARRKWNDRKGSVVGPGTRRMPIIPWWPRSTGVSRREPGPFALLLAVRSGMPPVVPDSESGQIPARTLR